MFQTFSVPFLCGLVVRFRPLQTCQAHFHMFSDATEGCKMWQMQICSFSWDIFFRVWDVLEEFKQFKNEKKKTLNCLHSNLLQNLTFSYFKVYLSLYLNMMKKQKIVGKTVSAALSKYKCSFYAKGSTTGTICTDRLNQPVRNFVSNGNCAHISPIRCIFND